MVDMNAVDKVREDIGITKVKLASNCGISVGTYENWLNKPSMVSAVNAKALAEALKITETERLLAIFFAPNVQENVNTESEG